MNINGDIVTFLMVLRPKIPSREELSMVISVFIYMTIF